MKSFGSLSVSRRRAVLVVGLAAFAVLTAASGLTAEQAQTQTQTPPPQQTPAPQTPAPAAADQMKFTTDSTLVFMQVAEANTADFELVMGKVKEALAKSDKPERKAQAAHWQVFKAETPPNNGLVMYVMVVNPVTKDLTYDPIKILQESGMAADDLQATYTKLSGALKGINLMGLRRSVDMAGASGGSH